MARAKEEEGSRERRGDDGNCMRTENSTLGIPLSDRNFIFVVQGARIERGIKEKKTRIEEVPSVLSSQAQARSKVKGSKWRGTKEEGEREKY